ncbi:MAG: mannose-1-phosphate guanylyltransferase [Candidatus Latescibacterota bacterium]|nr:MAG: mannose-1-phosphate guanylyltransferase [Candidatus Latescibacterota bacterium]
MIESKDTQDLLSWTYAVVMAGGKGKRFWPESRPECPKPLLKILAEESMLQLTVRRISQIVPKKNILVVTSQTYSSRIREHLPEIPDENIISEPEGRDTAACIGLAALYVRRIDPEGVMLVTPADHFIRNQRRFAHVVRAAAEIARQQDRLVTIGIPPTRPETGYGYIHRGEQTEQRRGEKVHFVKKFVEKPNRQLAQQYLAQGDYLWNSGIFLWKVSTILKMLKSHMPRLAQGLVQIERALGTERESQIIADVYRGLESTSIDYGVMEKADGVVVLAGDFGWSDVGSWAALSELLPRDENGNVIQASHLGIDTQGCFIRCPGRLVATIGVKDLVIVETDEALLICPKHRTQEVKKAVEMLEKQT